MVSSEIINRQESAEKPASGTDINHIPNLKIPSDLIGEHQGGRQKGGKPQNINTDKKKLVEEGKGEMLSNAEKKKRAKEEKIARRAKEKVEQGPTEVKSVQESETQAEQSRGDSTAASPPIPAPKGPPNHHRRTGSVPRAIPLRTVQVQNTASMLPSKQSLKERETKKVALFGHLYGQPRRTTIATASKDVHQAVLALGKSDLNRQCCYIKSS